MASSRVLLHSLFLNNWNLSQSRAMTVYARFKMGPLGAVKEAPISDNPFLISGPKEAADCYMDPVKKIAFLRADLLGAGEKGLKVWTEDDFLYFEVENSLEGGKYSCRIKINPPVRFNKEKIKTQINNGVLRAEVPYETP